MEAARRNHKSPIVDGRKRCGICKQWKLCDEFTKHPHGTGGIKSVCRICSAAKARAYAAANPNYQNEWRAKNPDSSRDNVQFRRAKRMDVDAELIDRREVFERDGNVCQLCDAPMDMSQKAPHPLAPSIDHVLAISRGGTHTMDNIQSAHFYCNSSKGDRDAPLTKPPLAA